MIELVVFILGIIILILSIVIVGLLKRSSGSIIVTEDEDGKKTFSLELNRIPEELENMNSVTFKIVKREIAD